MFQKLKYNPKYEKLYVILFFTVLTAILTWPAAWHFFSAVPSSGSDTMQVIGVAGNKANLIADQGFFRGTWSLIKSSEFTITTLYAYFQLILGRVFAYNLLFFLSFILSGFGTYLLADYFLKNKPAALVAGVIFAFSPFHMHNALGTNVGTMHQEWLPFFALYLFKFFDGLELKNFALSGLFLFLIALSEHQLLAFTAIFIIFFLAYKLASDPKSFLRGKLWLYFAVSAAVLSVVFFFMFRSLFTIANSDNNFLDAGFSAAVKYSNDSLSIFIPPNFHSFWSDAFSGLREQFNRRSKSDFSDYTGYATLIFSVLAVFGAGNLKKKKIPTVGLFFWLAVALGFYILSWGPYLQFKGVLDPPVKMPYYLIYTYLPYYKNIRTVGRFFVWSMLGFSVLAAWGMAYAESKISNLKTKNKKGSDNAGEGDNPDNSRKNKFRVIFYPMITFVVAVEFLAVPLETNSLLHSSFYEKLGQDKEKYSVIEVPGSTSYSFASRDLVWKSIHRKNTLNSYDFARVNKEAYLFQENTPIIRDLLYDVPDEEDRNNSDIMKSSYYDIANEILKYYDVRYIILDKQALKGNPEEGDRDMIYPMKAYISSVIECSDTYEDEYLYACQVDRSKMPSHMFLAFPSKDHWVGKSTAKGGAKRYAESGAELNLVNMAGGLMDGRFSFNLKLPKPMGIKVLFNGREVFSQYITSIKQKKNIEIDLTNINPGDNKITFGVYAADGSEIHADGKSDAPAIYQADIE
ncbi:MAG: hypothetical protein PHF35_00435 [Candidatus Moranbacteria bacterium]|nr:hypothetical protein [Candidatus Moranbacteria bacterium]